MRENRFEMEVKHIFTSFQHYFPLPCNCSHCKESILRWVVKEMQHKYRWKDPHLFSSNDQFQADVTKELTQAALMMKHSPGYPSDSHTLETVFFEIEGKYRRVSGFVKYE